MIVTTVANCLCLLLAVLFLFYNTNNGNIHSFSALREYILIDNALRKVTDVNSFFLIMCGEKPLQDMYIKFT